MGRVEGYRQLVETFGEGRVADALLAKWRADPDGGEAWERLAAAIKLSAAAGADPPTRMVKGGGELTRAQVQILRLSAEGLENKQIAETLAVPLWSVKDQKKEVFVRLRVGTITHAVTTALKQGILDLDELDLDAHCRAG